MCSSDLEKGSGRGWINKELLLADSYLNVRKDLLEYEAQFLVDEFE